MPPKSQADWPDIQTKFLAYLNGDPLATRAVFEALEKVIQGFFYARTRSETESQDLTQATLLKIHFARERFNPELSIKTWIFTIAGRCLIDHWRERGRSNEHKPEAQSSDGDPEETLLNLPSLELDPAMKLELNRDLNRSLNTLKPDDRTIVYLYAVEGLSMAEIAESLGMSEPAVKVRAHRSYVKLREQLS